MSSSGAAAPLPAPPSGLRRAELRAADAVGTLMELWGFKRQLGRVWTILFLSEAPLTSAEACERLGISTGLLSMSLAELRASMVDADPEVRAAARFRAERLTRLVALTRGALGLLGALLESARVDLSPLKALSDAIAGRRRT